MLARRIRTDGFVDPCIPSRAPKPPSGPVWVHEVKHDGYRLIVRRDGEAVRLFTRRGYDWTERYPAIAAAAAKLRAKSFTLDGEAVVAGADGVAVFDALHRRGRVTDRCRACVFFHGVCRSCNFRLVSARAGSKHTEPMGAKLFWGPVMPRPDGMASPLDRHASRRAHLVAPLCL
jgi:hypothetical protein